MENLQKLFDKHGTHIGWVVDKVYNDDFQSWDMRCYDLNKREYSVDASRFEYRLNMFGLEKFSNESSFYILVK